MGKLDVIVYRDAVTGAYVTQQFAETHPDTSVSETVRFDGKDTPDELSTLPAPPLDPSRKA